MGTSDAARARRAELKARREEERKASPVHRPLDDGPRDGTELWRAVHGIEFCHWDRWLLRLALEAQRGLDGLAAQFKGHRDNAAAAQSARDRGEALLLQTKDLQRRLVALKTTPNEILDSTERASDWLLKKAEKRVFREGPNARTAVMLATPKRVLSKRALRGHWDRFPISPAPFAVALERATDDRYYDYRTVMSFVSDFERVIEALTRGAGGAQRLSVHRAALTVIIEAMDRVDDSDADVAVMFGELERAYQEELLAFAAYDGLLRDFLELAVWEDYGLMDDVPAFLKRLPVEHAEPAYALLVDIAAELEREEQQYHLEKARELAAALRGGA